MQYLRRICLCLSLILLSACSNTPPEKTRFAEYAGTIPPIRVPPGINNPTRESYYPVPPVALRNPIGTIPPLAPPGSQLTVQKNKAKLPAPLLVKSEQP